MTRTLEVNIEKDPATGFVSVIVYDHYEILSNFSTPDNQWVDIGNVFAGQTLRYTTTGKLIFDGSTYQQDPRSMYIYYNGNYYSSNTKYLDKLTIRMMFLWIFILLGQNLQRQRMFLKPLMLQS